MARQIIILALALLTAPAAAWVPHQPRAMRPLTRVHSAATEDAVEFALKAAEDASAQFGKDSGAARAMWDAYEEVASSKEYTTSTGAPLDEQCEAGDEAACADYDAKMAELAKAIAKGRTTSAAVRINIEAAKDVNLADFASVKMSLTSPAYLTAKADAEAAVFKHGINSAEARTAWDIVEEIQASDNSATVKPGLDEECLLETMALCEKFDEALDALQKSIQQ